MRLSKTNPDLPDIPSVDNGTSSPDFASESAVNALPQKRISRVVLMRRRFLRNKTAVLGTIILLGLVFFAAFGSYFTPYSYEDLDFTGLSSPPGGDHFLGTTDDGGDLYAQIVHGLGRSLIIAFSVSLTTTLISAIVGATAAYFGGAIERIVLAIIHFMLVVPSFLIIALLVSGSGGDWKTLAIVLIAFGWMYYARIIWSLSMSIREREYVTAARYMGVSAPRIILRHIIPNISSLLIINASLGVISTVMAETGLSFLGLGVKLPDVSLGTLLGDGTGTLYTAPWQFYFPAATLTLLTVSMAFIADGLRDAFDPNSAAGGHA